MSERAAPFYCPYCGDEDLRPSEEGHGVWECRSCNRAFRLSFVGLLAKGLRHGTDAYGTDTYGTDEGGT
ncbi:MAG: hypothetical protein JO362_18355 [Streptomycetaceae bacterium]|nr:hypothetical protein [Streptomycetaceae bacterium]